jgi:cellulose synthase/poly-beta-1,6-N-acetylglucosamine synthase-like glycosyltransferase
VLLPCRNEEVDVLPCLDSLLASTAPTRVRVIDDGSTDATAELVRGRLGPALAPDRLELIAAAPLPAGWRGKVHALHCGLAGAEEPWLLSTDADTRHAPDALARAHETARLHGLDLVSFSGRQVTPTLGETLVTPAVFALLDALVDDWQALATGGGAALANGQFLLVRRAALEAVGGFEGVRNAPIDDVGLAIALRAGGFRTGLLRAPDALSVRMYRGFGESFRGWRRNLAGIFAPRPGRAVGIGLALLVLPALAPTALLVGLAAVALAAWAAGVAASALFRHGSGHSIAGGLLYPLDAWVLGVILLLGVRDRRRGRLASWKGRSVTVD